MPAELVVIDASDGEASRSVVWAFAARARPLGCRVTWQKAARAGAAAQRNQGVALTSQPAIWFFDDDVILEPDCARRLWAGLQSDGRLGGVGAMIVNQCYRPPGRISKTMFRLMAGRPHESYAGRVLGPAINLLPEDRDGLPDIVPVEWLNTTCAMYRREALPLPPFADRFTGYSLMEDVALSMTVARRWKLANVRGARLFHDSLPGAHKADAAARAKMELVNRHYVMTEIMGQRAVASYGKLALWQLFQLVACALRHKFGRPFWQMLRGNLQGVRAIALS